MKSPYTSQLLMPGVWQITDKPEGAAFGVDMYLLEGTTRAFLIDAGESKADLAGYIATLTDKPVDLVITHGHGDHTAGMGQFERVYMSHKDVPILNSMFRTKVKASEIIDLKGGEVFDIGTYKIEVVALPGHTPGSVVLLDRERQLLFTSDALGTGVLWMQLPCCTSIEAYAEELRKLEKHVEGMDGLRLYPGHDCQKNLNFGMQYIRDVRTLAEKIVSGEVTGTPTEDKSKITGGLSASYGQMIGFIYKAENIYNKR
ncbi:MAG TPA: MBL fold metallo-hydrolase [Candidatus Atribacteria bacterium]|nr:MBL fold metallo-hydrolase [Candidatus Atribacteria bacterium]HPT77544.1 MBL fold metallo-hydrolase [Candidatus Atribacteria bacterium]